MDGRTAVIILTVIGQNVRLFNLIKHPEYVGDSTSTGASKNSREQMEQARRFPVVVNLDEDILFPF